MSLVLEIGAPAPNFRGRDQRGREIALDELTRTGPVVVYFYSKDFTPICTREACAFRDAYEDFRELGAHVVGVSADGEATHARFAATYQIPFSLVADEDGAIQRAFDAFRAFGLFKRRVSVVIDRAGVVRAIVNHEMLPSRHAEDVRVALRELARR
ncbi:MAG TPA: peroxiredoxin [Byssovorax sp.]|jgi:peroxiredoxin Q/BCP